MTPHMVAPDDNEWRSGAGEAWSRADGGVATAVGGGCLTAGGRRRRRRQAFSEKDVKGGWKSDKVLVVEARWSTLVEVRYGRIGEVKGKLSGQVKLFRMEAGANDSRSEQSRWRAELPRPKRAGLKSGGPAAVTGSRDQEP